MTDKFNDAVLKHHIPVDKWLNSIEETYRMIQMSSVWEIIPSLGKWYKGQPNWFLLQ